MDGEGTNALRQPGKRDNYRVSERCQISFSAGLLSKKPIKIVEIIGINSRCNRVYQK
jgi:hypothetical protein